MVKKATVGSNQSKPPLPLSYKIMVGILLCQAFFLVLIISFMVINQLFLSSTPRILRQPETYVALPGGHEGYFSLVSEEGTTFTPNQVFTVKAILENTPTLDISQKQGITTADLEFFFDPKQLQAVDQNPEVGGVQAKPGTIFSMYIDNLIDPEQGRVYLSALSTDGTPQYPYNSTNRTQNEKVFATISFKVISPGDETGTLTIKGSDSPIDFTSIYTNIQGSLDVDILNQSLAPNNGNLELTFTPQLPDIPTATPTEPPSCTWNDSFESITLNPAWSWVREDPTHWSLAETPGKLLISTQEGDLYANTNDAKNIIMRDIKDGDFEISTVVDFDPYESWQQAVLIAYADDDNYFRVDRLYNSDINQNHVHITSEIDSTPTDFAVQTNLTTIYLKITRTGNTYTGYYSSNGTNWTEIGHVDGVSLNNVKVGLSAWNGSGISAPEIGAYFDWFCLIGDISPICGDGICDEDKGENKTTCYADCCTRYTILGGDLNKDCVVNTADWGIMWANWTKL